MPVIVYVDRAADCNVAQFMSCKFDNKYETLAVTGEPTLQQLADAWEKIHTEFIDLSGTEIEELSIMKQIKALECDIQSMNIFLFVQEEYIRLFKMPHAENLKTLAECGHKLQWNPEAPDPEGFLKQLQKVRVKESRKTALLDLRNKELADFRKTQNSKKTINNSRSEFIRLLNDLGKEGYQIDKSKTTVEELAIMIKDFNDYQKARMLEIEESKMKGR